MKTKIEKPSTEIITALAMLNIALFLLSIGFAALNWNQYATDAFEEARQHHIGDMWAIVAMFFWIGFCVALGHASSGPIKPSVNVGTVELLAAIKGELQWQRQQKEKEIHRTTAAQTTKS